MVGLSYDAGIFSVMIVSCLQVPKPEIKTQRPLIGHDIVRPRLGLIDPDSAHGDLFSLSSILTTIQPAQC